MIKHVVLAKFKAGMTEADVAELRKQFATLPGLIPEIKGFDFGQDVRPEKTVDFALVSIFEDMVAVKRYLTNPDHVVVGKYVRSLCENIQIIDFEYE